MKVGEAITVVAFNLDGTRRRWWTSVIIAVDSRSVHTFSRAGNPVAGPKGGWASQADIRACYWFERPYNLLELYDPAGTLTEIYVHIASPPQIVNGELHYTDHELDVLRRHGDEPVIADEDEFEQAGAAYDLTPEFQASCYRTVEEVTALIRTWVPLGLPSRGRTEKGAGDSES